MSGDCRLLTIRPARRSNLPGGSLGTRFSTLNVATASWLRVAGAVVVSGVRLPSTTERRRGDLELEVAEAVVEHADHARRRSGRPRSPPGRSGCRDRSSRMIALGVEVGRADDDAAARPCARRRWRRRRRRRGSRRSSCVGPTATGVVDLDAHPLQALVEVDPVAAPGRTRRWSRRCPSASSSITVVGGIAPAGADRRSARGSGLPLETTVIGRARELGRGQVRARRRRRAGTPARVPLTARHRRRRRSARTR